MRAIARNNVVTAPRHRLASTAAATALVFGTMASIAAPAQAAVSATPPKIAGFDPAHSTVVDDLTTPTRLVYRNPDGSYTARINPQPTRFQDATGKWIQNDLTLVAGADGTLSAKAAQTSAKLAGHADGATTVQTPAGAIVARHPGAKSAVAAIAKARSTYAGALDGRDLVVDVTTDGYEESAVITDRTQPTSYVVDFNVPSGTSARQANGEVDFVDAGGNVVARYGAGLAYDAKGSPAAVAVTLVPGDASTANSSVAAVQVGIDQQWAHDTSRVLPIVMDPTFSAVTNYATTTPNYGYDTMVMSFSPNNTYNYGSFDALWAMGQDPSPYQFRSLLWFNLDTVTPPWPTVQVSRSNLYLYANGAIDCTPRPLLISPLAGPFNEATNWLNQPPTNGQSWLTAPVTGGYNGCPSTWVTVDTTPLAQEWMNGSLPNYGMQLAGGDSFNGLRAFASGNTSTPPVLEVTYTRITVTQPIAVGLDHVLAVKTNGTVASWGHNLYGQLGNGTTTNNPGTTVSGLGSVASVAAGDQFSLALKTDGTVWAWGRNDVGQLGDGWTDDTEDAPWVTTPVQGIALDGMTAIAAGCDHALALGVDGNVWAWGSNASGQLGIAGGGVAPDRVHVQGVSAVVSIAAGCGWSMALTASGQVYTWGDNSSGQLGDGTTTSRYSPAVVPNLGGVSSIAAGRFHAMAVAAGGTVETWGSNTSGQLGNGTSGGMATAPAYVPNVSGVTVVAAGAGQSLALTYTGSSWAWGANFIGQLGNHTYTASSNPVQVQTDTGTVLVGAVAVAAGGNTTAFVASGNVRQAGDHLDGSNCNTVMIIPASSSTTSPLLSPQPAPQTPNPACDNQLPTPAAAYVPVDSLMRAHSASRTLNSASIRPSSGRPNTMTPVGYTNSTEMDRGHLLAYIFGGKSLKTDNAVVNVVALYIGANRNTPGSMLTYENQIKQRLVRQCETILYSVTANYLGSNLIPSSVHLSAHGNMGYSLECDVQNNQSPPPCA